ncbi:MAG: hypothetical protein JW909_05405 [Planctomycetes bacterium]|nr:hypothetical protein [Planctomycetota bacterium]
MSEEIWEVIQDGEETTLRLLVPQLRLEMREECSDTIHESISAGGTGKVTFDLTRLERIYSLFLGLIMDGIWQAKKLDRPATIILSQEMHRYFKDLGVHNAAELICRE